MNVDIYLDNIRNENVIQVRSNKCDEIYLEVGLMSEQNRHVYLVTRNNINK
jgi:hypothetical protein